MTRHRPHRFRRLAGAVLVCGALHAATFGNRVPVTGGPLDLVLDERRSQLYLVDFNTNAVDVYSLSGRRFLPPIPVGAQPVSAAISGDGKFLYVSNFGSTTLSVINLDQNSVARTIAMPAPPEGVAVGADGKVVITTLGTGTAANPADTLVVFNPDARGPDQLASVIFPPPAPATPPANLPVGQRPFQSFRGRLLAAPNGNLIIGVNGGTNTTTVFVYEVASQKVLRARTVPGLSSTLSISPDGSRFMAGVFLFDVATLNVLAQQSANNSPFPIAGNITAAAGGSVFSPDGSTLYAAFNVTPTVTQARPNSSTLLISNPRNLGTRLGIQLPENVLGKMVASSDGNNIYALSDSGLLMLPVGTMNTFPILQPETTTVRLSMNQCDRTASSRTLRINNAGRGALRFSPAAVAANTGLTVQPDATGLRLSMNPATTRRLGSTMTQVTIQSADAINIPPVIRVYQNWQNAETNTALYPLDVAFSANDVEGLADILVDNTRQRVYIANSGRNQVEVFDIRQQKLLSPIEVGQYPRSMAFGTDNRTLYVANSGGEWISMVDLDQGRETDRIRFPATPFFASAGPVTPRVIAPGIFGLQIFASTAANAAGQLWSSSGRDALLRRRSNAINAATIPAPVTMTATPGNEYVMLLSGNGTAYLYDSLADDYVLASVVMNAPFSSYYGPVSAGPEGRYFLANRAILNSTLVPMGGFAGGTTPVTQPGGGAGGGQAPGGLPFPAPGGGGVIVIFPGGAPGGQQQVPPGGGPGGGGGGGGFGQVPTPTTLRNVPAVAAVNATTFARLTLPQQANATATPTGDPQLMLELVDINTEQVRASVAVSEGPGTLATGNARVNVPGRWLAVDNRGQTAYVITASGLSVIPLQSGPPAPPIRVNPRAVVHGASYTTTISPGSLISIFGQNLAETATAGSLPLPTILGNACVTFNDTAVPLLLTSAGQINAQVPPTLRAGAYTVTVRSPQAAAASNTTQVNVVASAPGIFADPATGQAALFHASDLRLVTADNAARRDEQLILLATGLPPAAGVTLQPGAASPSSPLAATQKPRVFIGDPRIKESEMIVEWSGFTPGYVGLVQINIRVPGDRIRGNNLPVTVQVGNVSSPSDGPVHPVTFVQ